VALSPVATAIDITPFPGENIYDSPKTGERKTGSELALASDTAGDGVGSIATIPEDNIYDVSIVLRQLALGVK
jgi:hypothetical protein